VLLRLVLAQRTALREIVKARDDAAGDLDENLRLVLAVLQHAVAHVVQRVEAEHDEAEEGHCRQQHQTRLDRPLTYLHFRSPMGWLWLLGTLRLGVPAPNVTAAWCLLTGLAAFVCAGLRSVRYPGGHRRGSLLGPGGRRTASFGWRTPCDPNDANTRQQARQARSQSGGGPNRIAGRALVTGSELAGNRLDGQPWASVQDKRAGSPSTPCLARSSRPCPFAARLPALRDALPERRRAA
jgi:hypothetical protein